MKKIVLFLMGILPVVLMAQQLPQAGQITATNFIWNPAMTAPMNYWEVGAFHRQQWMGFNDAPRTTGVGFQSPIADQNMSIGGFIQHDQIHPLHSNAISFTYAYKLRFNREHQLSIGALVSLSEYHFNRDNVTVNDGTDLLIPTDATTSMSPNAGLGLYYQSYAGSDFEKTYYYAGIGTNQLLPASQFFEGDEVLINFKRAIHGNAVFGARIIKDNFALEPSVWFNYANPKLVNTNVRLHTEYYRTFWAGASFATSGTATFQAGVMLKNGILKDGLLRVGMIATYNLGTLGVYQGTGYEAYIAYRFERD